VIVALWIFALQGVLGAFDTLYYHEWRARLPGGVPGTAPELKLHGARCLIYAVLFGALPLFTFEGLFAWLIAALLLTEIVITLRDFMIEDGVRAPLGGVFPGERATHAVMGILYGAALASLVPALLAASARPSAIVAWTAPLPLRLLLPTMALGVLLSGVRDLAAAYGPPAFGYPWRQG